MGPLSQVRGHSTIIGLNLASAVTLLLSLPKFRAMADVLSGTLQIPCEVSGYAALAARQPKTIAKLTAPR